MNLKRLCRIYREERLAARRRRRKRVAAADRRPMAIPRQVNERWPMDFRADTLADGRAFRTLNIVDSVSRECLSVGVHTSLPRLRVTRVLDGLATDRGLPGSIVLDNVPELAGKAVDT